MVRKLATLLLAAGGLAGFAVPAAALGVSPLFTVAPLPQMRCAEAPMPSAAPQPVMAPVRSAYSLAASKSAAILGGASALDRIRMNQAAPTLDTSTYLVRAEQTVAPVGSDLVPSSGPVPCSRFALPRTAPGFAVAPSARGQLPGSDDFLQTRRLTVSRTAFDRQWDRVRRDTVSHGYIRGKTTLGRFAGAQASADMLAAVNAWTNQHIRFVEDAQLFGKSDHWAGAPRTLRLGAGDCEDIAITKMQLLAALGVPRSNMYLTIARDLARRADHAVLVVKMGERYWMLDNATNRVLDAGAAYDYQAVLSFSEGNKWLHGAVLAGNFR